ncbi:GATA type zinc finger [Rhizoctonia solani]|uniref:GATA type zinc finger n=1 Tax=Rhizoctonia solani TaxID=456999 RepID=A0A8H8NQW5_9AGAM|nr:GATA type zinc finger [Rhizoctonia solani]QRW18244.1 GATA type zinc finger [Rhizoctonia solani]
MASASPPPKHTQLPHPPSQRSPDARAPQYPIADSPAFNSNRAQPIPRTLPAPPTSKHATDSASLDAATAAITKAGDNLDVSDAGLLHDLCERLSNPDSIPERLLASELLNYSSEEMAKTRAAGLWEITARVAQERHFVCPPQMEGAVKNYIKMIDTVNDNSAAIEEEDLKGIVDRLLLRSIDSRFDDAARLVRINQSKPFQTNIPANTACLFCRKRKIKCDGSLPQCDMCMKHRQAKCEYPQKSHYGGFSNRGGLHYVVPMGPDIAAAAASSGNGAPPPMLLELGKAVKGYAPPASAGAPTYILPGPAPATGSENGQQASNARKPDIPRRDSYTSSTGYNARYNHTGSNTPPARRNSSAAARPDGSGDKSWDGYADEEEEDARPVSSTSSQVLQDRLANVEMEDGEAPRRRSPHTGNERCINCDTDKTSLWRKDEDGRTICNACQIYFRVHGRKRPPSMRSSTVKKRPGRQPRPSAGHTLPHDVYMNDYGRNVQSPHSSRSRSPPPTEYVHHQQQHLRAIEQAIASGQRTQPPTTAGLDYALNRARPRHSDEGYRGRAPDYVSPQDRAISPGARNSYNRDARAPLHPSPSVDMSMADATEDRHRRRTSDDYRRPPEDDDETEVQAGENLCAVEGGRSPADVLVFRFDADRAKSVCATQWAHLRSPNRTVEDDLRFHLNCYRKNPPDSGSQERVTLGVATDWLPKAGVYSITSGDEPPTSHHMAPPPNGKLNQTIDITSEIREGLNTLKFTQLRDMSDCVLVVQIWKVGRKSAGHAPAPSSRYGSAMSPVDKHQHSRAPPAPASSRGPPVYEASPSPGNGVPARGVSPGRGSRPKNPDADLKPATARRPSCVYCSNNGLRCKISWQPEVGCEECAVVASSVWWNPHLTDTTLRLSIANRRCTRPPRTCLVLPIPHSPLVVLRLDRNANLRIKMDQTNPSERTTPPASQATLPPMHHIQHVPAPPPANYPASAAAPGGNPGRGSAVDSRANQDLRRHQEMLVKQQQDAERESQRVLAGGLPTPYA